MNDPGRSVALVSGCSTGIGRAVAARLAENGCLVVAGARDPATLADLARGSPGSLHPIAWDVADAEATRRAVIGTIERFGRLDILINNAGYGQMGPIVELSRDQWRRQMETNVIGLADAAACAARAPGGMIERRRGRIVNISSILGRACIPFSGAYAATKYAVEAVSDTLRMELAPFGIQVVVVEPGPVVSSFSENARRTVREILERRDSPYEYLRSAIERRADASRRGFMPTEVCAGVIVRVATMRRPPARLLVTPLARIFLWLKRLLPDRALDAVLRRAYGLKGAAPRP